ncbi:MAG: putative phosphoglycerate mutase [archaeon GW2011_AR4]|nr:MAG: putative phosphoglycerate mutase [archaeon GW2011_AR4]
MFEQSGKSFEEFRPDGGESFLEVQDRVVQFIKKTLREHPEKNVLIVTHSGVISSFLIHLCAEPWEKIKQFVPKNTAVSIIELGEGKNHKIHLLNCARHLDG